MPLDKSRSKTAFHDNVRREVAAGKPVKQAVAIAYATQRKASGKSNGDSFARKLSPNRSTP